MFKKKLADLTVGDVAKLWVLYGGVKFAKMVANQTLNALIPPSLIKQVRARQLKVNEELEKLRVQREKLRNP